MSLLINAIFKNVQPYLIVVGFTIRQAFSLVMTMAQEWLFTFRTNKMLQRKLQYIFLSFGSNIIFSRKQTNHVHYLNMAEVY